MEEISNSFTILHNKNHVAYNQTMQLSLSMLQKKIMQGRSEQMKKKKSELEI